MIKQREPLLTEQEHHVIETAGQLWNDICLIPRQDLTRDADLRDLVAHIHAIQHAVMAQAAARAYPDKYRLLGGGLNQRDETEEG